MTELIENLIEALREELKQYGEMLALLDQQQECVLHRQTQDLLQGADLINSQATAIQAARSAREQYQRTLARGCGLPDEAGFAAMRPLLPSHYGPLLEALVEENNDLLQRIHRRGRQNQLLLSRTVELMQRFVSGMFPALGATTYTGEARLTGSALAPRTLLEALG
jgi:hypothetical protein